MCQYRAVGHPIAAAVTEGLVDLAASKIGMDPVELRRRNLIPDDAYPCQSRRRPQIRTPVAPRLARQASSG
jgi:aerobic carbon-monoxide dehydrogenase large subunit